MMLKIADREVDMALIAKASGKKIVDLTLHDKIMINACAYYNCLRLAFDDTSCLMLFDDGQNCCEKRYASTDDDLVYYVGAKFLGVEERAAPSIPAGDECHDVVFLVVHTDRGEFVLVNHNEHNGYYGGFCLRPVSPDLRLAK